MARAVRGARDRVIQCDPMNPRRIDLNLLPVFVALLETRNVSRAAERLGVTQPAVSNALARLRTALGDELFVRGAGGVVPTPHAERLAVPIAEALATIDRVLDDHRAFDPDTSARIFRVATTEIGEIHFLPTTAALLSSAGPGVTIESVRIGEGELASALEDGRADLAMGHLPASSGHFRRRLLFTQRYVCAFGTACAADLAGTLDAFARHGQVGVVADPGGRAALDAALRRAGIARDVRLLVPNFVALRLVLESSDLVALVPEAFASRGLAGSSIRVAAPPVALPAIEVHLVWHERLQDDDGHRWLRERLHAAFATDRDSRD